MTAGKGKRAFPFGLRDCPPALAVARVSRTSAVRQGLRLVLVAGER